MESNQDRNFVVQVFDLIEVELCLVTAQTPTQINLNSKIYVIVCLYSGAIFTVNDL